MSSLAASIPIALPARFPLIGLGVIAGLVLNLWQGSRVMALRKTANVPYPTLYVSDADAAKDVKKMQYNCAQRAHQNTVENIPYIYGLAAYLSIFRPELATASLLTWMFGRVFYTTQYASGNPKSRNNGLALTAYLGLSGLLFGSIYTAAIEISKLKF